MRTAWRALWAGEKVEERETFPTISLDAWANMFSFNGITYPLTGSYGPASSQEVADSYGGLCGVFKRNSVIFACEATRLLAFSEARFQFRQLRNGRPGDLFGTQDLGILETPWPNGTTGDLLARAELDTALEGNFYAYRQGDQLYRMRPDWVTIVLGSRSDAASASWQADAEIIGYLYHPGGRHSGEDPVAFLREQVAHWAPIPDPEARFRGMSWLTPVIREIMADGAATEHKLKFFQNGATPNMVVTMDGMSKDEFIQWQKAFREAHVGAENAYKTLFFTRANDVKVVGADMRQIDFKITQGAGETRIAAAARVPPSLVGLSEGLQGSALNAGNFGAARRQFADGTMRPLWRSFAAAISVLVAVPGGAELWYDDRDIMFLQEDQKDRAEIQQITASTMVNLVNGGYDPDSVTQAVISGDLSRLVHTQLVSVQLQPPGTEAPTPTPPAQLPPARSPRALLAPFLEEETHEYA